MLGKDEPDPKRIVGQQFFLDTFFLAAAGLAVGDDDGQSPDGGFAGEGGEVPEFEGEQGGCQVTKE